MKAPLLNWPTWLRYALAVLALALACPGCGATPYERATNALGSMRAAQAAGVQALRTLIADDLRETCEGSADTDACVDARLAHWRPVETAVTVSAESLDALALALYAWGRRALDDEDAVEVVPPGFCELGQRTLDQVLRIVAETSLPLPAGTTFNIGCDS